VHEAWARFLSSSMKDDLRYAPSDCFETFPFPEVLPQPLEEAGRACYAWRADLMSRTDQGLTDIYNRFHDPLERDADIVKLREFHAAMDRAVLDAYDWLRIPTGCDFFPEHDEASEDVSDESLSRKVRY